MKLERVTVKVPASSANLGPGFDTLGMALNLYTWIELSYAPSFEIKTMGEYVQHISRDRDNLVYRAVEKVFSAAGEAAPELSLTLYSEIPLARGLGSSAAAIVGGMVAANALLGEPFSQEEIFHMATALEGHPDNVAAALFGGIVVAMWDGKQAQHIRLSPPQELDVLLVIPEYRLSTAKARGVLPKSVSFADATFNISHASLLVAAFATGNVEMIATAMQDRLHQPYRAKLVPGLGELLSSATEHGALGIALSGAGPTILAFANRTQNRKSELEAYICNILLKEGVKATLHWLQPVQIGATIYENGSLLDHV